MPPFPQRLAGPRRQEASSLGRASTGVGSDARDREDSLADLLEVVQVGPTRREFHHHATRGLANAGGNFDQPRAPGAGLAFAQRVVLAAAVVPVATLRAGRGLPWALLAAAARAADRPTTCRMRTSRL